MSRSLAQGSIVRKDQTVVPPEPRQDKSLVPTRDAEDIKVDLVRKLLRVSIDLTEWKDAAVAEAIGLKGESGAAYFSKMLSGEKPISAKHLRALPDDIEQIFARLYAESFGLIVVAPVFGNDAVKQLVAGIFGVLATRLPERSTGQLKASMGGER